MIVNKLLTDKVLNIRYCRPLLIVQQCVTEVLASQVCQIPDVDHPEVIYQLRWLKAANITVNHVCRENLEGYSYSELSIFLFLF